jgi:hypothetical protein
VGAEVVSEGLGARFGVCVRVVHGGYGVVSHWNSKRGGVDVGFRYLDGILSCYGGSGQSRIYFSDAIRDSIENAVKISYSVLTIALI